MSEIKGGCYDRFCDQILRSPKISLKMKLNLINGFQSQRPVTIICSNKNGEMALSVKIVAISNTG